MNSEQEVWEAIKDDPAIINMKRGDRGEYYLTIKRGMTLSTLCAFNKILGAVHLVPEYHEGGKVLFTRT